MTIFIYRLTLQVSNVMSEQNQLKLPELDTDFVMKMLRSTYIFRKTFKLGVCAHVMRSIFNW